MTFVMDKSKFEQVISVLNLYALCNIYICLTFIKNNGYQKLSIIRNSHTTGAENNGQTTTEQPQG